MACMALLGGVLFVLVCTPITRSETRALADEISNLRFEHKIDMKELKTQRAVADILMTLARPPREDEDEGKMIALALAPWKDQRDVPCVRKLAFSVVQYRTAKTDAGKRAAWEKIRAAREECG